ncbi:hypothetical protein [Mesorhizobium sp.]|nr:MAG: hypothetical protein EOS37_02690 [Mesorhizobium sp.]
MASGKTYNGVNILSLWVSSLVALPVAMNHRLD